MWGRFIVWFLMVFFLYQYICNSFENSYKHQEIILGFSMFFSFCVVNIEKVIDYVQRIRKVIFAEKIKQKKREEDKELFLYELWKKEQSLTMEEEVYLKFQIKRRIENMKLDDIQIAKLREQEEIMKSGTLKQLDELQKELQYLEDMAR